MVDDGSTDGTADLLRQWERGLPDDGLVLRYMQQDNQGAPIARNRALRESRGQYIQYLDSDDLLHPEKLSRQVATFAREAVRTNSDSFSLKKRLKALTASRIRSPS